MPARSGWCWGLYVSVLGCGSGSAVDAVGGGAAGAGGAHVTEDGRSGAGGAPAGTASGAASVGGCRIFPPDNPWNQEVSSLPVHPDSDALVDSIGRDDHVHPDFGTEWEGAPIGIPFVTVDESQPDVPVVFQAYGDESDPGPYPIPLEAPIEGGADGGGDRHVIALDLSDCRLYELYRAFPRDDEWHADSGAVFDLTTNDEHPVTFTSADAAGLPIFPGLVRYEEIMIERELRHAVRVTVSQSRRAIIPPARHHAGHGDDPSLPPMGLRLRLKASHDCSSYSEAAQIVCAGLKRYGVIVADNGSDWYLSGAPDPRWDDDALGDLKRILGNAFEAVQTGDAQTY